MRRLGYALIGVGALIALAHLAGAAMVRAPLTGLDVLLVAVVVVGLVLVIVQRKPPRRQP